MKIEQSHNPPNDQHIKEFVSLLTASQARLYSYILSLSPNFNEADDLLQETTKLMWEKFGDFKPGTDFIAWGKRIAYILVMQHYRIRKKEQGLCLPENLIETLEREQQKHSDRTIDYLVFLKECMKKLNRQDRRLLRLRYHEECNVREISSRFGFTVQYIYKNISRIHQLLLGCVQKRILFQEQR